MSGAIQNETLLQKLLEHADEKRMHSQEPVFGVTELRDLPYFAENGTVRLLDVYLPQNAVGMLPIIVDVHGGVLRQQGNEPVLWDVSRFAGIRRHQRRLSAGAV